MSAVGNMVKEEKKPLESNILHHQNNMVPLVNIVDSFMEIDAKNPHASAHQNEEDQIKSARAEMEEVKEENERLKSVLGQLVKDYQSLHMHFLEVLQKEADKKSTETVPSNEDHDHRDHEEPELVSLSLGRRSSSEPRKESTAKKDSDIDIKEDQDERLNERLKLGLDCRFDQGDNSTDEAAKNNSSFDNSMEETKEEEPIETWPPSKTLKTARSADHDDDVLQQSHLKKARVSIRARCETPTMNDGCQWRKYGQKIAKGNPCPRAYYRCTISPTCPVRKQVQRCADDMSILITTYEGNHNHPLPVSATAMASTTSAAASMLNSRSSSSQPGLGTSTSANLHGLNFTLPHNSTSTSSPQHLYFPHSSITTNNSHPTITLDLTAPTTFNNFNRFSSTLPRPSPSCLSFSSSTSSSEAFHQTPWSHNGYYNNYNYKSNMGSMRLQPNNNPVLSQEHLYQPYGASNQNPSLTETIAAATKAITSNPNFRSALTAALTSYVGSGAQENHGGALPPANMSSGFPFAQNGTIGCATSFLNKSSTLNTNHHQQQQQQQQQQQHGSLVLFPPSGRSKSGSGSPPGGGDNRDHVK